MPKACTKAARAPRAHVAVHLLKVALVAAVVLAHLFESAAVDTTEHGCTCLGSYTVDAGVCNDSGRASSTYAGCMPTPCDGNTGGAVRGFQSWCLVELGCTGALVGAAPANKQWDYCNPAPDVLGAGLMRRERRAVAPIASLEELVDVVKLWTNQSWSQEHTNKYGTIWEWDVSQVGFLAYGVVAFCGGYLNPFELF